MKQYILLLVLMVIPDSGARGADRDDCIRPVLYVLEYKTNTFRAKVLCAQCIHLRAPPFYC